MNDIEMLREAARLMRERAEKATPSADPLPGGWAGFGTDADMVGRSMLFGGPAEDGYRTGTVLSTDEHCDACTGPKDADVQHIASWHPAVALAVADWLDESAGHLEEHIPAWTASSRGVDDPPALAWNNPERLAALVEHHYGRALAVARAYLGVGL